MSEGTSGPLRVEVAGGVGTIRLDRPPMNALDTAMQEDLRTAAADLGRRRDVSAVIVYGGPDVFAAGVDVKEMARLSYVEMLERVDLLQTAFTAVARIPKPTVAAVTGYALGGGCELALACDIRICADTAKLGQPEILLGIIPGAGGTQRLPRLVGPSRAKDLIFTGRFVGAQEAKAIGLVDVVVPAAEVYEAASAWAARFAGGPAWALRAAKVAVDAGLESDLETGLGIERAQFAGLFATEDRAAGMQSFLARGPGKATFQGR